MLNNQSLWMFRIPELQISNMGGKINSIYKADPTSVSKLLYPFISS